MKVSTRFQGQEYSAGQTFKDDRKGVVSVKQFPLLLLTNHNLKQPYRSRVENDSKRKVSDILTVVQAATHVISEYNLIFANFADLIWLRFVCVIALISLTVMVGYCRPSAAGQNCIAGHPYKYGHLIVLRGAQLMQQ